MDYSEKDLENAICEHELLYSYGIHVLEQQYRTEFGIIDILGYCPDEKRLAIIEVKKGIVDESAVGQVMRYMAAIYDLISVLKKQDNIPEELKNLNPASKGILIGNDATSGVKAITRCFPFLFFIKTEVYMDVVVDPQEYERAPESLTLDVNRFVNSSFIEPIVNHIAHQNKLDLASTPTTEE